MATVYRLNKGINRPIEFKGLQGQYILYLGLGLVSLLLSFTCLYLLGVPVSLCLGLVGTAGTGLFLAVFRLSHRYGQYGLMKRWAFHRLPKRLRVSSRQVFLNLRRSHHGQKH